MSRAESFTDISEGLSEGLSREISSGISVYYGGELAEAWLKRYQGQSWQLAIALAFTETALIPGISAAGKTAGDRQFTAHADAEFLHSGLPAVNSPNPAQQYALPPLTAGLSPVLISRALLEATGSPAQLINAGLAHPLNLPQLNLALPPARCLSTGAAMTPQQAQQSFERGLKLGETWPEPTAQTFTVAPQTIPPQPSYAVLGECVVGGTTTALGLLMGLGVDALGRVNSSHGQCNHEQKAQLVAQGLAQSGLGDRATRQQLDPIKIVAALGDPMQPFLAGYAIALSRHPGVLLAGGTQMLAVYALAAALAQHHHLPWQPENIAIGTTRWVATDPTGDTPGLAAAIEGRFNQAPNLLATDLSFAQSQHPGLRAYEEGFVKEGVGAGGCAIATSLSLGWSVEQIAEAIEAFVTRYSQWRSHNHNPAQP